MSRSLGSALPPGLVTRFSQTDLPSLLGRGLPFVTLAADGTLHPMLCSYLEWLAVDARMLRLAIAARSRSARNLEERGVGTLLLVEPGLTIYIKCRATGAPLRLGELARFSLAVEDVLEDAPTEAESDVRITGGITYAPAPSLEEAWAKAVLAALRAG
jgi:flavin reductase (DIM6/NTAB) family NADH-FMN oxidoreductase RutF